jgi:hypothetical protein
MIAAKLEHEQILQAMIYENQPMSHRNKSNLSKQAFAPLYK